jgi:hypothetical protein
MVRSFEPLVPVMLENTKGGGEALGFLLPVEQQRSWSHDEGRTGGLALKHIEKGEHLNRLPESHVVRKATADTCLTKVEQPAESLPLIGAKLAAK